MDQAYILANVTKSQNLHGFIYKELEIVIRGNFEYWLSLFLLDMGEVKHSMSLENICLRYVCKNKEDFPPSTFKNMPKSLLEKLDVTALSEQLLGEWAGDRLIITGDHSDMAPFPPNGKWKTGNLYNFVYESGKFSCSHIFRSYTTGALGRKDRNLHKFCGHKIHKVVNLDKKEYLDPPAYGKGENCVLDFMHNHGGVIAGLVIYLIHSTRRDLPDDVTTLGMWAGDRITICTPDQLEDFETYEDVSNPDDVEMVYSLFTED